MIYFDSAATTMQKPASVYRAMERAFLTCASPGRGGHKPSLTAAKVVYNARQEAASLFGVEDLEKIVFTQNATHALNIAINSVARTAGKIIISGYEHNSVVRPLNALKQRGIRIEIAQGALFAPAETVQAIERAIDEETVCVVVNHMSNVFGFIQNIEEIDALCARKNISLIIDASQSAGLVGIDAKELQSVAFICMPGHKSLYGPQGTGILICCKSSNLYSLMQGGTGSNSIELDQPDFLPDIFESGTLNVPGIAGLCEGIRFVKKQTPKAIRAHKKQLLKTLHERLANMPQIAAYYSETCQNGLLSFTAPISSEELCALLDKEGFCLRAGLHCAPLAHKSANTLPDGTVRVSFSVFNDKRQVYAFADTLSRILRHRERRSI